jgi:hypothetical protein
MARRNPMHLLDSAVSGDFGSEVGFDPASVGFDPASIGDSDGDDDGPSMNDWSDVGAAMKQMQLHFTPAQLQAVQAKIAAARNNQARARIRNLTAVGQIPAGTIAASTAIGIGATVPLVLQSYIPLRIYRVDATAAVTATGLNAAGSVVINSFQFANRGLFDGTGTPTLDGFRPDANGRPPIRNIVVYPNTPITLSLTNNNAAAVTASIILYGSTVGR